MCFPIAAIIAVLIWCVVICAVVMILRLLLSFALPRMGVGAEIVSLLVQVLMIILCAVFFFAVITVIGDAITCLIGLAPPLSLHR